MDRDRRHARATPDDDAASAGTDVHAGGTDARGASTGDMDADAGNAGTDAGNTGTDAGNTGTDAGNTGADAGNTGTDAGNAGTDAGNTGTDAGNTGADAGNTGADDPTGMKPGRRHRALIDPHDPTAVQPDRRRWVLVGLSGAALAGLAALQLAAWGMPWAAAGPLGALLGLPVLLARPAPLAGFAATAAGLGVATFSGYGQGRLGWPWPATGCAAVVVLLYSVAVRRGRRWGPAAWAALVGLVLAPAAGTVPLPPPLIVLAAAVAGGALWLGDAVRARRAAQLRLQEELARLAVLRERAAIARELHDVVAHHLSLIAIEAQAAPHRSGPLPPAAAESFAAVHSLARDGLTQMRAVVSVLRDATPAEKSPLPDLAGMVRRAGRGVSLSVEAPLEQLPAAVQLAAFRIVQECLSNAARHASGGFVRVSLGMRQQHLTIRVYSQDPKDPAKAPGGKPQGFGIVGMRERAEALGGTLTAGPTGEGFLVVAEIPA